MYSIGTRPGDRDGERAPRSKSGLRKFPFFASVAVLWLLLGIGANAVSALARNAPGLLAKSDPLLRQEGAFGAVQMLSQAFPAAQPGCIEQCGMSFLHASGVGSSQLR